MDNPSPNRSHRSGFTFRCKPIKAIELVVGQGGRGVQQGKKLEQAFSPRAFFHEAAPDGFVFIEPADVFLDVVQGRYHSVAVFVGGMHGGDKRA
jgi:hypothetical protein